MNINNFAIDRSKYDSSAKIENEFTATPGISEELVRFISHDKHEPEWILQKRLAGLKFFLQTPMPKWGPDLSKLDLNKIIYYVKPGVKESKKWSELPEEIRKTAERIGVPEAERNALGGAGFQFDSSMAYHHLKKELQEKGVIFENFDTAVQKYPQLVAEHFMSSCVPVNDHKFAMLHSAVFSGGTFIYVPQGVKVSLPLQAYFRMNAIKGGQFEHTLIIADKNSEVSYIEGCSSPIYEEGSLHAGCVEIFVKEGAKVKYMSIENWSRNTYNLNTKRALVDKNGTIEWINGNMGSGCTMLYPSSILRGEGAKSDSLGIAFANSGQIQDTGSKVIHAAPNTSSIIKAKSISKSGGSAVYRGLVKIMPNALGSTCSVNCDALLIDDKSNSETLPYITSETPDAVISHEASVGKIGDEEIFYLMSRGIKKEQALQIIVSGFASPIIRQLPLEYAVELNKLIELEMEESVG